MAHIQPGDVIFFEPDGDLVSRLIVFGQSLLSRRRVRWSHVALCVTGALVVHATPKDIDVSPWRRRWLRFTAEGSAGAATNPGGNGRGVHLELLEREYVDGDTFTVARPLQATSDPNFPMTLREASIYWLAERYSFVGLFLRGLKRRRTFAPGRSFCSFLVQKVFERAGPGRFGALELVADHALMPGELYEVLSADRQHWQVLEHVDLFTSDAEQRLASMIRERSGHDAPAVALQLAESRMLMAGMLVDANIRMAQIEQVRTVSYLLDTMNQLRRDVSLLMKQAPPAQAQAVLAQVQGHMEPLLRRIDVVLGRTGDNPDDLLFMNYRSMIDVLLTSKLSQGVDLTTTHWWATKGHAVLRGPDEQSINELIAKHTLVTEYIALRHHLGETASPNRFLAGGAAALEQATGTADSRWNLPTDVQGALQVLNADIQRLDACDLPDWQEQRGALRRLLERKVAVLAADARADSAGAG